MRHTALAILILVLAACSNGGSGASSIPATSQSALFRSAFAAGRAGAPAFQIFGVDAGFRSSGNPQSIAFDGDGGFWMANTNRLVQHWLDHYAYFSIGAPVSLGGNIAAFQSNLVRGIDGNIYAVCDGVRNGLPASFLFRITPQGSRSIFPLSTNLYFGKLVAAGDGSFYDVGLIFDRPGIRVVKLSRFGTVLYDRTVAASDGDVRPTLAIADLHGNLWVEADDEPIGNTIKVYRISESAASILGRSTINNSIVSPTDMALGPDGNVWLTLTSVQSNCIERIDAITGASRCFAVPTPQAGPFGITAGNDGALWFTEQAAGKIGRIATNGTIAEFREPYVSPTLISAPPRMSTFNAVRSVWFVAHVFDFVATTY